MDAAVKIAITGHRPDKLGGYDANNPLRVHLRNRFKDVLLSLVAEALTFRGTKPQDVEVYVGGALGFDIDAARVCAETVVPFVVAVPFPSQWKRWKPSDQAVYRNMLTYAKRVEYVSKVDPPKSDGVDSGAINMMYARNRYMVDRCDIVVAAWDGSRGGTGHCVEYARQKGKEIIVLVPGHACYYGIDNADIQGAKMYYINPQPVSNTL
jgi:uncharacterized phage-like protein YoqJ